MKRGLGIRGGEVVVVVVRLDEQLVASHKGLLYAVAGTRYRSTQSLT